MKVSDSLVLPSYSAENIWGFTVKNAEAADVPMSTYQDKKGERSGGPHRLTYMTTSTLTVSVSLCLCLCAASVQVLLIVNVVRDRLVGRHGKHSIA